MVRDRGREEWPGERVCLSDKANVTDFQDAVKATCPNRLASVDASQLPVYATRAAFDTGTAPQEPQTLFKRTEGRSIAEALVVVARDVSLEPPVKRLRTGWRSSRSTFAKLLPSLVEHTANSNTKTIKLSADQLAGLGVMAGGDGKDLVLYRRDDMDALFKFLDDDVLTNWQQG